MMQEDLINVSSIWEEHSYVSNKKCSCGGNYICIKWHLHPEKERMLEIAFVKCQLCDDKTEFWFDVTLNPHRHIGIKRKYLNTKKKPS